ncbi:trigger factor [Thermodesulfobacteriota bacterium]
MTNIQVEDLSDVKKRVTFEIPHEKFACVVDSQFRDLKKTVQLKGFRKGKVPLGILRAYFKDKVEAEAKQKLIEETFRPGLDSKNIVPVSVINIEPEEIDPDKPFRFTAEIEVTPPFEIKDYKGLKLTKYIREVSDDDLSERLDQVRENSARLVPLGDDGQVKKGDHLTVDIKALSDGEEISELTVVDYRLELGRNYYLPDFDSNILGMSPNQTSSFTVQMPEDLPNKLLAGKTADFEVTIKDAKERVVPDLDDDFAQDLGEYETLEKLKDGIREEMGQGLERRSKKELESQIVDALIESHEFDMPESMVENQIDMLIYNRQQQLIGMGIDPKQLPSPPDKDRERFRPNAERTVRAGLILKAIAEKESMEFSDEELLEAMEKQAEQVGFSADYMKDYLEKQNLMEDFRAQLLQDKIVSFIIDHSELTEEEAPPEDEPGVKAPATEEPEKE